jgi:hypothetical protein
VGRNVLVVVSDAVDVDALAETLASEIAPDTNVRVVGSPALSPLQWLTNDEDDARRKAVELTEIAADAAGGRTAAETTPGDSSPLQAVEDALRTFPADEVLVVVPSGAETDTQALESRDVPVRQITLDPRD